LELIPASGRAGASIVIPGVAIEAT
jgi:hypothetical protein